MLESEVNYTQNLLTRFRFFRLPVSMMSSPLSEAISSMGCRRNSLYACWLRGLLRGNFSAADVQSDTNKSCAVLTQPTEVM